MEERSDNTWGEALHTYNTIKAGGAITCALTSATTLDKCCTKQLTYTNNNFYDAILTVCDRDYKFAIFDPYERIKGLEEENKKLKNMLKEYEL